MNYVTYSFLIGGLLGVLLLWAAGKSIGAETKWLIASWYGAECQGKLMANGKPFNPKALTCACWDYPLGTYLKVTHKTRSVVVQVTDRGPAKRLNRAIDLSFDAFAILADPKLGLIEVKISRLPHNLIK